MHLKKLLTVLTSFAVHIIHYMQIVERECNKKTAIKLHHRCYTNMTTLWSLGNSSIFISKQNCFDC